MGKDFVDPGKELPPELFHEILQYLEAPELAKATRVSKLWNQLAMDGNLWQSQCSSRWEGKRYMRRLLRIGEFYSKLLTYPQPENDGERYPKSGNGHIEKLNPNLSGRPPLSLK